MRLNPIPTVLLAFSLLALPAAAQECVGRNLFETMPPERLAELRAATDAVPYHQGLFWQADKNNMRITLVGTYHFA
ncbi:MAG: TraB/GumN family protein, partial [Paracoccus sp.]|nr:TraB/GumN family protein [Paracoccus sp. (in: a-proteobacteria)]